MSGSYESLPGKGVSLWLGTTPGTDYPPLDSGHTVDVVVLGGGIVGLTTAYFLQREGLGVAVVEARRIAGDVTGNTTAKITAAHGLVYRYLASTFGEEGAHVYAQANQDAIRRYESLIGELGAECDFSRTEAYTFTEIGRKEEDILSEVEAARVAGLPVSYVTESPLPFSIAAAIRYRDQARFHPRKFLLALSEAFVRGGGRIYENTRALEVSPGDPVAVSTSKGTIKGKHIVLATHFPIYDPAFYFARMYPRRSYVLGCLLDGPVPDGMFYSAETPMHSVRPHPYGDGDILLIGGESHKTGHGGDTIRLVKNLERYARDRFPVRSIEYRWAAQDNMTMDRVPYIGLVSPRAGNIYTATGFGGWGMSHSMVAAIILTDRITGRPTPWAEFYDPSRLKAAGLATFIKENLQVGKDFIGRHVHAPDAFDPAALPSGEGGVIDVKGRKTGYARGIDGSLHAVDPVCPHMGCIVGWNNAEQSWDCPCHGSRFDGAGTMIHGPATKDLSARKAEDGGQKEKG